MLQLTQLLDTLEAFHGIQQPTWPTDPYLFLVWWHCGYPASDTTCAKGWEALRSQIGVEPDRLLAANPQKLALALKPGGMVPELRAMRLKEIAERIQKEFGDDLRAALNGLSLAQVRAALKKFPNIADPGVDRILLFGGISPVPAVPSNCPHVLVRIQLGQEHENYGRTYGEAQRMIEAETPAAFDRRIRAYLLLKCHGQQLCKRTNPKCSACLVAPSCAFFAGKMRGRPAPAERLNRAAGPRRRD
jgi:endonuclease-3